MKKLLLSLLCIGFAQGAFGAASAGDSVDSAVGVETSDQRLTLVSCSTESYLSELENVYVRGRKAKMKECPDLDDSLRSEFRFKCKGIPRGICLGESTVGCILSSGNYIQWIVIDPEHQGQGLACKAIDMFARDLFAHQSHLNCIYLTPLNAKLENFYLKKCGFTVTRDEIEKRNAIRQECVFGEGDSYIPCCLTKHYQ